MRKINVKPVVALLFSILFVMACHDAREGIRYLFPSRIDKISMERAGITNITYSIKLFYSNDKSICPADSVIVFRKNGTIFNSKKKIGHWKKDGTLYLDYFKKRFFFNWITPGSCNFVQLQTTYYLNGDTNQIKRIRIFTRNTLIKDKIQQDNEKDEFAF